MSDADIERLIEREAMLRRPDLMWNCDDIPAWVESAQRAAVEAVRREETTT